MTDKNKKTEPIQLRVIEVGIDDIIYRGILSRINPGRCKIEIFETIHKQVKTTTEIETVKSRKTIALKPIQLEGIKIEEIAKRAQVLAKYLETTSDHSTTN